MNQRDDRSSFPRHARAMNTTTGEAGPGSSVKGGQMKTNQLDKDHYATSVRECMKNSMELPAGEWKPLNRVDSNSDFPLLVIVWISILTAIGSSIWALHGLWLRIGH